MKVKTLLAVIEAGGYTKTAQKLNLTQPAVSHQVRLLENESDIRVFYKSKNRLELTPQGKMLVRYAHRTAAVYSNACQATADSKTEISHLNAGITPMAGEIIVPQVLTIPCNENPDIHIDICVNTIQKIYNRLRAYELGSIVVEGGVPDMTLVSTTLDTDYLYLTVSPMHRLSRVKTVSVEGIHHEELILRSRSVGIRQLFERHLGVRDMSLAEFNVTMEPDNVFIIKELVTVDLGVTIIAKSACRKELASGCLVTIPIENSSMVRQIDMVYRKDFLHPGLIQDIRGIREQSGAK